jgi:hypothetical protein
VISLDITQCHERSIPKLSQRAHNSANLRRQDLTQETLPPTSYTNYISECPMASWRPPYRSAKHTEVCRTYVRSCAHLSQRGATRVRHQR